MRDEGPDKPRGATIMIDFDEPVHDVREEHGRRDITRHRQVKITNHDLFKPAKVCGKIYHIIFIDPLEDKFRMKQGEAALLTKKEFKAHVEALVWNRLHNLGHAWEECYNIMAKGFEKMGHPIRNGMSVEDIANRYKSTVEDKEQRREDRLKVVNNRYGYATLDDVTGDDLKMGINPRGWKKKENYDYGSWTSLMNQDHDEAWDRENPYEDVDHTYAKVNRKQLDTAKRRGYANDLTNRLMQGIKAPGRRRRTENYLTAGGYGSGPEWAGKAPERGGRPRPPPEVIDVHSSGSEDEDEKKKLLDRVNTNPPVAFEVRAGKGVFVSSVDDEGLENLTGGGVHYRLAPTERQRYNSIVTWNGDGNGQRGYVEISSGAHADAPGIPIPFACFSAVNEELTEYRKNTTSDWMRLDMVQETIKFFRNVIANKGMVLMEAGDAVKFLGHEGLGYKRSNQANILNAFNIVQYQSWQIDNYRKDAKEYPHA
jgi:hypothetical protein